MTKSRTKLVTSLLASLLAFTAGAAVGCTDDAPEQQSGHCANQAGDETCAALDPALPYCDGCGDAVAGCVAERPTDDMCYFACGGDQSILDDDSCVVPGDGDGDPTGDGDGDNPCMANDDCTDPATPFCDSFLGKCVFCYQTEDPDASCASLNPDTPVCDAQTCVQCTPTESAACGDDTPVCDADTNVCVACTAHEQCGDGACNIDKGTCFEASALKHVDKDDPACTAIGPGTPASPYCTLSGALASLGYEKFIMLHETEFPYSESVEVGGWVAIFAAPLQSPKIRPVFGQPGIVVHGYLFARGLEISGEFAGDPGVEVRGSAWIESSRVVDDGGGILVDGGGMLVLENSLVGGNRALYVADGAATILYSTLAGDFGNAPALRCNDGTNTSVRNSLLVARGPTDEVACPKVTITDSALEMDVPGNVSLGVMPDTSWFVDYEGGDFHLSGSHPPLIDTAATWQTGDPTTDIDGDSRPVTDASPDFAGADRVQ